MAALGAFDFRDDVITAYALLLDRCGLSREDAAAFHLVRPDTVASWRSGRNRVPPGIMVELRALYARIEHAAAGVLTLIAQQNADTIELGIVSDDHEARALGWPCAGAQAAMLGIVAARTDRPVVVVPRGSTLATAAAIDASEGG